MQKSHGDPVLCGYRLETCFYAFLAISLSSYAFGLIAFTSFFFL